MRQRVLVTGGAGFSAATCASGYSTPVTRFFASTTLLHLQEERRTPIANPRFELMRHDVTFPLYVEVDEITTWHVRPPIHYQRDPVQTTKTSVHGSINMLGLAKRTGAKILLTSTSEVYGDPSVHPQTEDYWGNVNPVGPRSCYDEGKRCAETLFFDYRRQHDLPIKGADLQHLRAADATQRRPCGEQLHHAGFAGEPLTVYGDGSQTRSFCYVDDPSTASSG